MVSGSRSRRRAVDGFFTFTQSDAAASGDCPLGGRSSPSVGGSTIGSWSSGTGCRDAVGTVDDRDRGAPEPLARDQPVAQAVRLGGTAGSRSLQLLDDLLDGVRFAQPVERTRVDHPAVAVEGLPGRRGVKRRQVIGQDRLAVLIQFENRHSARHRCIGVDDNAHRQAELAREVEVALVMRGHCHDGAVAVVG
jgi:hypothetical protein